MSSEDSSNEQRVEEIVDQFLAENARETSSARIDELVEGHPELAPKLEEQLRIAKAFASAFDLQQSDSTSQPSPESLFRIRCPHCGNHVRIVDDEATCGSCGSGLLDEKSLAEKGTTDGNYLIGRFEIIAECGRGAFGTVYEAFDPELSRSVAIKVLRSGTILETRDKRRFIREAQSAAKLRHANIVQIHEIGFEEGKLFIVSDYIFGPSLDELAKTQKLPYRRCAEIVEKISRALHFAHQRGLIHRDVKPSNILLDEEGEPFLADFGLARELEPDFTVTREGEIIGTPAYMSPEQAAAEHGHVNAQSDVYCAGVMLYRLLTGHLPFRGTSKNVLSQVMNEPAPAPKTFDDQIPFDLATIALKAMEKDKKDRYSNAEEMADDIRRWMSGDPVRARRLGWQKVLWLRCKKHPWVSSLIAGVVALMLALTVGSVFWALSEAFYRGELDAKNKLIQQQQIDTLVEQGVSTEKSEGVLASLPYFETAAQMNVRLHGELSEKESLRLAAIDAVAPTLTSVTKFADRVDQFVEAKDGVYVAVGPEVHFVSKHDWKVIRKFNNTYRTGSMVLSPDESRLISIGRSSGDPVSAIKVWDTQNGRLVSELRHDTHISSVGVSPDSKKIVSADLNRMVKIWNLEDGTEQEVFSFDEPLIPFVDFVTDEQFAVVTRGMDVTDSTVLLWDLEKKEKTRSIDLPGVIYSFCLAKDRIFVGMQSGIVHEWRFQEPDSQAKTVAECDHEVISIEVFAEGLIYRLGNNQFVFQKRNDGVGSPVGSPGSLAYGISANGAILAASDGGTAHSWWTQTGDSVGIPLPHGQLVTATSLVADRWLAVGGAEGLVKIWDLASTQRNEIRWDELDGDVCVSADVSSLVDRVAILFENENWELRDLEGRLIKRQPAVSRRDQLKILPHEKKLLIVHPNGEVSLWDLDGNKLLQKEIGEKVVAFDVCDKRRLMAIASPTAVELFDLASMKSVLSFEVSTQPRCVRFDENCDRLFVGAGKLVSVWDIQSNPLKMTHSWNEDYAVKFIEPMSPQRVAVQTLRFTNVWKTPVFLGPESMPERLHHFRELAATKSNPAYVEEFDCLVTVDKNGFIAIRESTDLEKVRCLIRLTSLTNFWVDDELGIVVCGTGGGRARTFDLEDGREVLPAFETFGAAKVKLTEDRQFIFTQSKDRKAVLRRIYEPNFSFEEQTNRSAYLSGKQFVEGQMKNAEPELQVRLVEKGKSKSSLSEDSVKTWNMRVERLGLFQESK